MSTVIVQAGNDEAWVGKLRLTQDSRSAAWVVDTAYSGLAKVDDNVLTSGLPAFVDLAINGLIENVISGLGLAGGQGRR